MMKSTQIKVIKRWRELSVCLCDILCTAELLTDDILDWVGLDGCCYFISPRMHICSWASIFRNSLYHILCLSKSYAMTDCSKTPLSAIDWSNFGCEIRQTPMIQLNPGKAQRA